MDRESRYVLRKIILDILCLFIVGFPILLFFLFGQPYKRGFYCDDESLRHPYKDSTVSSAVLYVVGMAVPICSMLLIEYVHFQRTNNHVTRTLFGRNIHPWIWNCYTVIGVFGFGMACSQLTTDIAKYTVGRLRPHFFDVCKPDIDCSKEEFRYRYIEDFRCQNTDKHRVKDMRLSFPSGHSSFSAYTMIYLVALLKELVKDDLKVIETKMTDTNTNKSKTKAWQKVHNRFQELNARERTLAELKQQWRCMKLEAKKSISVHRQAVRETGGGPKPPSPSTDAVEILEMIPLEFEVDHNQYDSDYLLQSTGTTQDAGSWREALDPPSMCVQPDLPYELQGPSTSIQTNLSSEVQDVSLLPVPHKPSSSKKGKGKRTQLFEIYLQARFIWKGSKLLRHFLQFLCFMMALGTALSRISDYKHHWSDVLIGALQGALVAVLVATYVSDLFSAKRTGLTVVTEADGDPPSQSGNSGTNRIC